MNTYVVLDLETTGLNEQNGRILEVGAILLHPDNLTPVSECGKVIHVPEPILSGLCDEWCTTQHKRTGLWDRVINSSNTIQIVEDELIELVNTYGVKNKVILIGNNIGTFDMQWIKVHMPRLHKRLHYRVIDLTTMNILAKKFNTECYAQSVIKEWKHTALNDCRDSLRELNVYLKFLFRKER